MLSQLMLTVGILIGRIASQFEHAARIELIAKETNKQASINLKSKQA